MESFQSSQTIQNQWGKVIVKVGALFWNQWIKLQFRDAMENLNIQTPKKKVQKQKINLNTRWIRTTTTDGKVMGNSTMVSPTMVSWVISRSRHGFGWLGFPSPLAQGCVQHVQRFATKIYTRFLFGEISTKRKNWLVWGTVKTFWCYTCTFFCILHFEITGVKRSMIGNVIAPKYARVILVVHDGKKRPQRRFTHQICSSLSSVWKTNRFMIYLQVFPSGSRRTFQ